MSQKGTTLVSKASPLFDDYIVVKDTWRERDNTNVEETADDANGTINFAYDDPGVDASCTWVLKADSEPVAIGDQVDEASPGTRKFVVSSAETYNFGTRAVRQDVTLRYKASLAAVLS